MLITTKSNLKNLGYSEALIMEMNGASLEILTVLIVTRQIMCINTIFVCQIVYAFCVILYPAIQCRSYYNITFKL